MAWRFGDWVLEGELDNTVQGHVNGWIQLAGRDEPLQLALDGNCDPDLAGWKFKILRLEPIPDWIGEPVLDGLSTEQTGNAGDMTALQTAQHFSCSVEEFVERSVDGDAPPAERRPAVYLEWYSNQNGRTVIQCTRLTLEKLGEQAFVLQPENESPISETCDEPDCSDQAELNIPPTADIDSI